MKGLVQLLCYQVLYVAIKIYYDLFVNCLIVFYLNSSYFHSHHLMDFSMKIISVLSPFYSLTFFHSITFYLYLSYLSLSFPSILIDSQSFFIFQYKLLYFQIKSFQLFYNIMFYWFNKLKVNKIIFHVNHFL